jgi:hypothetical protein
MLILQDLLLVVSGALGALLLRTGAKIAVKVHADTRSLAEYYCSDENANPGPGVLSQGWGKKVSDPKASNRYAWAHGNNQVGSWPREHTIYGPYTNDFGKPGFYKVTFRVRCLEDLPPSKHAIVVLDVVRAPFSDEVGMALMGQRVIRAKDLKKTYKRFNVYCHYTGGGIYEYRCSVIGKDLLKPENTVLFDTIKIYRDFPLGDVF